MTPLDWSEVTAADLRAAFDEPAPMTVGLEEEVMLLDPENLDLAPRARDLLGAVEGDERFKLELPAAQLEILTPPCERVPEAANLLAEGRGALARSGERIVRLAAAGAHPFAAQEGPLNTGERYERLGRKYGTVARRQLVFALQVHVALRGSERVLAVYNALRSHLPEIAALAANAPFHGGRDTGLASVRPTIAATLPRQGVPPALSSWEEYAAELRWGARARAVTEPRLWWWELRPHPVFGTLEVRVADTQTTVGEAAAIAAVIHSLVGWLAARHDAGERLTSVPLWRIVENRWSACRHGLDGQLADLESGELVPTRERLGPLLESLREPAKELGCVVELESATGMLEQGGAKRQRAVAARDGLRGLAEWLTGRFLAVA